MHLDSRKEKGAPVITASGDLDTVSAEEFDRHLKKWLSQGEYFLVIDFSGLEYISSAGLRVIAAGAKYLKPRDGKIFFVGVHGHVLEVFRISYFLNLFGMFDRLEDALNKVGEVKFLGHLQLYGKLECQGKLLDFISAQAADVGFDPMRIKDIRLAVEEILTNIFEHAYRRQKGEYEVSCKVSEGKFVIEISDSGAYFDINAQDGMGAFIINKLINHKEYRRLGSRNVLKLILPLPRAD